MHVVKLAVPTCIASSPLRKSISAAPATDLHGYVHAALAFLSASCFRGQRQATSSEATHSVTHKYQAGYRCL